MNPDFLDMGMFLGWFNSVSILFMLLLLYNFIPDRYFIIKKIHYSLFVGLIFSFAAIIAVFIHWVESSQSNIGFSAILIPMAGFFGGPVSAGIITVLLLLIRILFEDSRINNADGIIFIVTAIIGTTFYYLRERKIMKISPIWMRTLISIVVAAATTTILILYSLAGLTPGFSNNNLMIQITLVVATGVFVLSYLIQYIDQKKESDYELVAYREHLEALVQERTTELESMNALHQATIESTPDGIVVIDFNGSIQAYNHAAARILDITKNQVSDTPITLHTILKTKISDFNLEDLAYSDLSLPDQHISTNLIFNSGNVYEIHITPYLMKEKTIGNVINFRDITKRKHAEDALQTANQKLILLSGITRHDILNQLTALNLCLNLIAEEVANTDTAEYILKADHISHEIQYQVEFTRDYQDIGLKEPGWVNLAVTFEKATKTFKDQNIRFSFRGNNIEIYSDPLLERVFYNLIDNSIRHGGHVTSILVSTTPGEDTMIIRYEDDGCGVDPRDKKRIFEKGFGKHTGLGMFLIHEILSITGIVIEESGTFGTGVRFDIIVHAGKFRILD